MIYLLPWEKLISKDVNVYHRRYFLINKDWYYNTCDDIYIWNEELNWLIFSIIHNKIYSYSSLEKAKQEYDKILTDSGKYFLIPEDKVDMYKVLI